MSKLDYCLKCGNYGHTAASCKRRYLQRGIGEILLIKIIVGLALAAGAVALYKHHADALREEGRKEVRAEWAADRERLKDEALQEAQANAVETKRRLEAQRRNQEAQDVELARARSDARLNAAAADQLRDQNVAAARQWSAALGNSPTREQLAAAGAAIELQADVLGRLDRAATELAAFADASRAAGIKCARDYDALTMKP